MNIVRQHRRFEDFCMILWIHMTPRVFFLDVVKSSECDLFSGALVVRTKLPEPTWNHLGSSWIISGIFQAFHKFVISDMMFATSTRCLAPTFQTSKVIEIQNGDQIQIRRIELVMGKIVKPNIYV